MSIPPNIWDDFIAAGPGENDLDEVALALQRVYRILNESPGWGRPINGTQYNGTDYALNIQSIETVDSHFAHLRNHDSSVAYDGDNTGHDFDGPWAFTGAGTITGNVNLTGTFHATGAVDFDSTLNVDGAVTLQSTLHGVGAVDFDSTLNVDGAATFNGAVTLGNAAADTITVPGTATFAEDTTFTKAIIANGNVTLGNAAADVITVTGTATFAEDTTFSKNISVLGNTTLGNAGADTVSIVGTSTTFSTVASRILADMTNGTHANRFMLQSSTANSTSLMGVLPSGSGSTSGWQAYNGSNPDAAAFISARITTTEAQLMSSVVGAGAAVPLCLYSAAATKRMEISSVGMGFFATAPVAQPAAAAAATDLASVITLANSLRTGLRAATGLGLFS